MENIAASASAVRGVRTSIVGDSDAIPCPVGPRLITYVDHTASGRAHAGLEAYITDQVLPLYANTHSVTTATGLQSEHYMSEARGIIREAVNASDKDDAVLFCGRGASAASALLAHLLLGTSHGGAILSGSSEGTSFSCSFPSCHRAFSSSSELLLHARTHPDGDQSAHAAVAAAAGSLQTSALPLSNQPHWPNRSVVVVVGPYVHHSSLLPWRERGAQIIHVPEAPGCTGGGVDLAALDAILVEQRGLQRGTDTSAGTPLCSIVGVFTVASNITGACSQVDAVTALCHARGALAVWDAAAAISHMRLDMNPVAPGADARATAKDALYFSCHKLAGGPSTPGVLVVKRALLRGGAPSLPGGGTVMFVRADGTPLYHANDAEREEGGTPDVVAAVRAGLCFQLMRAVGLR